MSIRRRTLAAVAAAPGLLIAGGDNAKAVKELDLYWMVLNEQAPQQPPQQPPEGSGRVNTSIG